MARAPWPCNFPKQKTSVSQPENKRGLVCAGLALWAKCNSGGGTHPWAQKSVTFLLGLPWVLSSMMSSMMSDVLHDVNGLFLEGRCSAQTLARGA